MHEHQDFLYLTSSAIKHQPSALFHLPSSIIKETRLSVLVPVVLGLFWLVNL
jgi:hypothetical protein